MSNKKYDVVVVGGGASGMMAAIVAARSGVSVLLIEKNKRLGEKLRISGGGRCNITNAEFNARVLLKNYGKAEQYLYSSFAAFGVQDTIDFFADLKLPIKVEARNRAFPVSEKASDVVHCMQNALDACDVDIAKSTSVDSFQVEDGKITAVKCGEKLFEASQFILATGGVSHPETGSTGDGFGWLEYLGHSVREPSPNITPLKTKDSWNQAVSGISLKDAAVRFTSSENEFSVRGPILITHFGLSGPVILNNAYRVAELLDFGPVSASVDCCPDMNDKQLDIFVITTLNENGAKQLKNTLSQFVPAGFSPAIVEVLTKLHVDLDMKASEVSKLIRQKIVMSLKSMTLGIEGLMGFERAVVADGGVNLKEIDMRTMRSLKIENLYITGDLLDINRPSGGFSLQLCWTTGYVAGKQAAEAATLGSR